MFKKTIGLHAFFYKNIIYKNIQDEICQKVKNVLKNTFILGRGTIIFHLLHILRYRFTSIVNFMLLFQIYLFLPSVWTPFFKKSVYFGTISESDEY